jgi:hypothetical protein
MPYKTEYLDEEGGVITTYWGTVTDDEVIKSGMEKAASIERVKAYKYILTDLSGVDEYQVSSHGIKGNAKIASRCFAINDSALLAFVLPSDLEFGMGRMWQAYADQAGRQSRVFRTRREAEKWLKSNIKSKKCYVNGKK